MVIGNFTVNCTHCDFEIADSKYGKVLRITTDGKAVVKGCRSHPAPMFSPSDDVRLSSADGGVYVYSSGEAEIKIIVTSWNDGVFSRNMWSSYHLVVECDVKEGWNLCNFTKFPGRATTPKASVQVWRRWLDVG